MKHYALNMTILSPVKRFGEKTTAHIKASDITEASLRAEMLIALMIRRGTTISKWWYIAGMEMCQIYTIHEILSIHRDRFRKVSVEVEDTLKIKGTIG